MFLRRAESVLRQSVIRQTLLLLVLFSVITVVAWGSTYWLVYREIMRSVDDRLVARLEIAVAALNRGDPLPEIGAGQTLAFAEAPLQTGFIAVDVEKDVGPDVRYLVADTPHGQLVVGEDVERQEELLEILAHGLRISLAVSLVATISAGLWLSRRNQARLRHINDGLRRAGRGDLSTRIALDGQDDLSLIANRIDATTEQLEHVMLQMRVQSSNIAHDLRTPLARLRAQIETNLEALVGQGRSIKVDDLEADLEQIDQIDQTFDALLRLARLESGAGREAFARVHLDNLLDEVVRTYRPVVEAAGQTLLIKVEEPGLVWGDASLLVQLLANLIQNAIKHGAPLQTIEVALRDTRLIVTDQGSGIPTDERDRVMQPLYQGQSSRQGAGTGLGLAMVRAICELHDAEYALSHGTNGRGLSVSIEFPKLTNL